MAARQGLSAQISQASEDAKQKLLSHAPLKSSWFSNLNTTCTIKSAPPRTPEVLSLLSQKSGWLWKRNEQHVWQARWCCVVPHTFLYYFDDSVKRKPPHSLSQKMQARLNEAVKSSNRPHSLPRSSFNVFGANAGNKNDSHDDDDEEEEEDSDDEARKSGDDKSPPAGIIDLECYTAVHRSQNEDLLLELAGDDAVNPDLRSFYFYCQSEQDSIDWTQALLQNRHASLQDELEAFREVSTGFASQLQELHVDLDYTKQQLEEKEQEVYSVRSSAEETRRTCFRLVEERLEEGADSLKEARAAYRRDLESARDLGTVVPAVQLLSEYTQVLEKECTTLQTDKSVLSAKLQSISSDDATRVKELEQQLKRERNEWQTERTTLQSQVTSLEKALQKANSKTIDIEQQVSSQKMEMQMYQSSTKQRLGELLTHKKILKREVIDLRKKLDDSESELSLLKHTQKTSLENIHQERKKSELLEKYVERMESQVKVQQSMMEYMSTSAAASVQYMHQNGGGESVASSFAPRAYASEAPYHHASEVISAASPRGASESVVEREHHQLLERAREMVLLQNSQEIQQQGRGTIVQHHDEDEKSHMSELTEDRTQKHLYAMHQADSSPATTTTQQGTSRNKVTPKRLPSYIGVGGNSGVPPDTPLTRSPPREVNNTSGRRSSSRRRKNEGNRREDATKENGIPRLDTIMSGASQQQRARRHSTSSGKLSVAQRARQQAESQSCNSIRIKPPPPQRATSESSLLGSIGQSLTDVIDNTVLGIQVPNSSDSTTSSYESEEDERDRRQRNSRGIRDDITNSETGASEVSVASTTMSLQERQAVQRAKQLAFLKEQGLIKSESNLRGGAGATPSPQRSTGSRTSSR